MGHAMELDDEELEELIESLQARLSEPQISEEWWAVIHARQEALASGASHTVPWSEVRERMFKRARGE